MTTLTSFNKTDGVDDHVAADINKLIAASLRAEYRNAETISATRSLVDADCPYQVLTASGADRIAKLPAAATTNHPFVISNGGGSNNVIVQDSAGTTTYATLLPGEWCFAMSNGSTWKALFPGRSARVWAGKTTSPTTGDDSADGVAVGDRWIDETADKEYVALDVTVGAAVWTATGGGSGAVPHAPGGRPTLVSGTPVMTSEQAAKTTIYYTPFRGDLYPSYSGSVWTERSISELSLALDSASGHTGYHQSGKNYDLFLFNDSGTDRLGSGPAWTSDTARGTGAGTTELERKNGILTNKNSMTMRFGSVSGNTVTVPANQGTYVGSFRCSADGTTTWELGGAAANGDEIRMWLWSAYNRVQATATCGDTTDSWTNNSSTWRSLNSSNTNRASFICGINEDPFVARTIQRSTNPAADLMVPGIALDATNATNAQITATGNVSATDLSEAVYQGYPGLGYHYLQETERAANGGGSTYTGQGDGGSAYLQVGMIFTGWF